MPRPHIALVIHDFDAGFGQGRYGIELVRRLSDDFDFSIVSNTYAFEGAPNVRHLRVPALRSKALTTILSFVAGAERALKACPAALVHSQGLCSWRADVVTAHLNNTARYRQSPPVGMKARLFGSAIPPLERAFYRRNRAASLISISGVLQREILADYGWQGPRQVIYHGTDAERFAPTSAPEKARWQKHYGLDAARWNWLFMGEAVKGLEDCILALKAFPEARLLVVTRSAAEPWLTLAQREGVAAQLHWQGFEPRPENAFKAADLFCYPSDYDAFGMVAAEAMASGLPVVLGRSIGAAELVQEGRDGLLCTAHDSASLVNALRQLAAQPERAQAMAAAGRARILAHGWDACARATAGVYEQALRARAGRAA